MAGRDRVAVAEERQPAAASLIVCQFLAWVAARPRLYAEAAEAWRSTCPATCAWEDAISDGLVAFERLAGSDQSRIVLTVRGSAVLDRGRRSGRRQQSFDDRE